MKRDYRRTRVKSYLKKSKKGKYYRIKSHWRKLPFTKYGSPRRRRLLGHTGKRKSIFDWF